MLRLRARCLAPRARVKEGTRRSVVDSVHMATESAPTPEPIIVRYGNGVDDEIQLRIEGGTLLISVPKAVKNLYLTAGPFHELRAALADLANHVRPG